MFSITVAVLFATRIYSNSVHCLRKLNSFVVDSSAAVSISRSKGCVFDSEPLTESSQRLLSKIHNLNHPGKKQIFLGFPPIAVTQIHDKQVVYMIKTKNTHTRI